MTDLDKKIELVAYRLSMLPILSMLKQCGNLTRHASLPLRFWHQMRLLPLAPASV